MSDIEPPDMSYFCMNINEIMMQYSEQWHMQRDMYVRHGFEHAYHGTLYMCTCMFLWHGLSCSYGTFKID